MRCRTAMSTSERETHSFKDAPLLRRALKSPRKSRFRQAELIKLGNVEIDAQHSRMFLLADVIVESLVNANGAYASDNPLDLLQTFINFSYQHFAYEEGLMQSAGYPGMEMHAKEHSALLEEIARHRYLFELGHRNVDQITGYLRDWINRHIDQKDRELVDWLKAEAKLNPAIKQCNEGTVAAGEMSAFESNAVAHESAEAIISRMLAASGQDIVTNQHLETSHEHVSQAEEEGSRDQFGPRKPISRFNVDIPAQDHIAYVAHTRSPFLRQTVGLLTLVVAYFQYYFIDVQLQIISQPSVMTLPVVLTLPVR